MPKEPFFDHVCPEISTPRFFFKNPAMSLFLVHQWLTLCKKSKKTNEPFSLTDVSRTHGHTDGLFFQHIAQLVVENTDYICPGDKSRTRHHINPKFYMDIKDHNIVLQTKNQQNLMHTFRESVNRVNFLAHLTMFDPISGEPDFS